MPGHAGVPESSAKPCAIRRTATADSNGSAAQHSAEAYVAAGHVTTGLNQMPKLLLDSTMMH